MHNNIDIKVTAAATEEIIYRISYLDTLNSEEEIMCTTLLLLFIPLVSSFSSNTMIYQTNRFHSSSTELFGTIRFVGDATASYDTPPIAISTEDKSLSQFLYTSASDEVLCGAQTNTLLEDDGSGDQLWRCQQAGVEWFGMTVLPIFINR